jgi:hypothetical protein
MAILRCLAGGAIVQDGGGEMRERGGSTSSGRGRGDRGLGGGDSEGGSTGESGSFAVKSSKRRSLIYKTCETRRIRRRLEQK